jgi:hypothetical protein
MTTTTSTTVLHDTGVTKLTGIAIMSDMVVACRSNPGYAHGFDVVTGKIANDNVGETIAYVVAGVMRKEDALERLRFQQINNQFAFCTEKALSYLTFESSCTVEKQP